MAPAELRWAVELREPSWLHDDVFEVLRQARQLPSASTTAAQAPLGVDRRLDLRPVSWAARSQRSTSGATAVEDLHKPATQLRAWLDEGIDAYAYFNNDYQGHAVTDAQWLRRSLSD